MSYQVHIARAARRDLERACDYIEFVLKNQQAAYRLFVEAEALFTELMNMPKRYALVDDELLSAKGVRSLAVKNYIAFYTVSEKDKTVNIFRFLHGKSDWMSTLHRFFFP